MSLLAKQEKYWDSVSEEKGFTLPLQMSEFEKVVSREMAILDVGCGYGRTLGRSGRFLPCSDIQSVQWLHGFRKYGKIVLR